MKRTLFAGLGLSLLSAVQLVGCASDSKECLPGDIDCAEAGGNGKADGWDSQNDPRYFASHLEYTLAELPKRGFLETPVWKDRYPNALPQTPVAWADTYWPSSEGSHNNRWMGAYCAVHPDRLYGIGQTALRTPAEGIADLEEMKKLGLRGVMLPGLPGEKDYDDPMWDPFWEAAIDLGLPLSFHILTTPGEFTRARGPWLNFAVAIIRANQDIIGMLIYGGVFERHEKLRIVCVEADAGWAPHWMYRMDHYYTRHHHLRQRGLERLPSEQFREHVYLTFQDDWSAFATAELQNPERLMWANDFPHSDSCWPRSQEIIREHTKGLHPAVRDRILHDNVAELYAL